MSEPARAVFLSYAREDAEAAKRIAEALRAFGVEVWFDQAELRGGDAWDTKIRGQIKSCALFIPIVSACTEERTEGYFRREWKLAVDRSHDMAGSRAFIVPVVIDATPETEAAVPEEFMKVQWTRLAGGEPTPEFVAQVKRLLDGPKKPVLKTEHPKPASRPDFPAATPNSKTGDLPTLAERKAMIRKVLGAAAGVAAMIALICYDPRRGGFYDPRTPTPAPAAATPEPKSGSDSSPTPQTGASSSAKATEAASGRAALPDAKSIAVLPFTNLSTEKDNEFFADGMHDEVITALAKVRDLTVISRTSVLAYRKAEGRNLRKIAEDLGVASVLEGSVQRAGDRVKVIVQLIDAGTDRHLWAETYVESLTDVFTIQSKLAGDITKALKATLSPEEKSRIAARPTTNSEAYDYYLRGRARSEALAGGVGAPREAYDGVVALYERAVELDPKFTRAQAELCYQQGVMYWFGHLDPMPARRERAKAALDAALRHGPDLPETHMARGTYLYACENDWTQALAEFQLALAGLPNDAQLLYMSGLSQRRLGRVVESIETMGRAVELNPRDVNMRAQQLISLRSLHRFPEWLELGRRYLEQFPENVVVRDMVSAAQLQADGDRPAFFRRLAEQKPTADDPFGLRQAYRNALLQGKLEAAAGVLADSRLETILGRSGIVSEPVILHRALVAWLRDNPEQARLQARQALAAQQGMASTRRQEPWRKMGIALAHALAGQADEAVRLAREAAALAAERDGFNAVDAQLEAARVYVVLGRRDEALTALRSAATNPSELVPELIRIDPLWARVKDDPRFEEILKSIKPL